MNNYKMEKMQVIIGFPAITELRIGSAIRIAISYYDALNKIFEGTVEKYKLRYLLDNAAHAYKYRTVVNYINYALHFYLGSDAIKVETFNIPNLSNINKDLGYRAVPCKMAEYLNNEVLEKLIEIALMNLEEDEIKIHKISIKKSDYIEIYRPFFESESDVKIAGIVCKDIAFWLEYNQIIRVHNFYVMQNGDIEIPIKFSFIEKLGGRNHE